MVLMIKYRKKGKSKEGMIEFWEVDLALKSFETKTQISPQPPYTPSPNLGRIKDA